jgi:hypothetical protein
MNFSTYVTTWGTATKSQDPLYVVQDMISKNALYTGSRIILAFASFNFTSSTYIPGFGTISISEVQRITSLVHSHGANISLSIGGATYPFYNSDMYDRPGDLAFNINQICQICGFDGVDFDIEDYYGNVPSNFATQSASVINTLRSLNNNLYISLTTPAQAWGQGMYQQSLLNMTIGNINAWQPMEYDLWVDPSNTYTDQIESDIDFYIHSWGVDPAKIVLGLMPGPDDIPRNLSLQDALNLTSFSISSKLRGVMTWDANIDSFGADGNAPYAYCCGIQSMLNKTKNKRVHSFYKQNKANKVQQNKRVKLV